MATAVQKLITMSHHQNNIEEIRLYRGGVSVSNLFDSLGKSLKETRITAALGYLFSISPERCRELFSINDDISENIVEANHEYGRADIQIDTINNKRYVIEAKLPAVDPQPQSLRYKADYHVLLTNYPYGKGSKSGRIRCINWNEIGEFLSELTKSKDNKVKTISNELLHYLQRYQMVRKNDSVEIYMRELNRKPTLDLFLKSHLYVCPFQKGSRLPEARYFSPHFGKKISDLIPGIMSGISYVARITRVEMVLSKEQLKTVIINERGKRWFNYHRGYINAAVGGKIDKSNAKSVVFLGQPRLIFNPPIKKENIQKGKGWLSRQFISFDELFEGWMK